MTLGDERLTTTDEKGNRIFLFPAEVRGFFRRYRTWTQWILIVFFAVLPWIQWNGTPIILLDIAQRTFYIGTFIFKAHDTPLIFLLVAIAMIALAFVTALFGRVWCGWACPQTVFIDGVYRRIEIWVQGNYIQRRKLDKQEWNWNKIRKIGLTWILYIFVSFLISAIFVAYFVPTQSLYNVFFISPSTNWTVFSFVVGIALLLLFDFGWFREQFCIIACPYGRFQASLMDKKSISVLYDENRGEPRKSPSVPKEHQGDCVGCNRCVEVCPTGIDIRRGIQMECIGCTACIDACDEIMDKVKKPRGLIRYASEFELEQKQKPSFKERYLRPRVLIYFTMLVFVTGLLVTLVGTQETVQISVLKPKGSPYTTIQENGRPMVLNHFKLHVHNQGTSDIQIHLNDIEGVEIVAPKKEERVPSNSSVEVHFFIKFPLEYSKEMSGSFSKEFFIQVQSPEENLEIKKDLHLVGP